MPRILLLMATRTYRAKAFLKAARRLGVPVTVGSERRQILSHHAPGSTLTLDFRHPERAVAQIAEFQRQWPLAAIVGVDDDTTLLAAQAAAALGLPHNAVAAVRATRDKHQMRARLAAAGLPSPGYRLVSVDDNPRALALAVRYPCVLKPTGLSASRGVIRADDPDQFMAAFARVAAILAEPEVAASLGDAARQLLIEDFVPGPEVALEGLLVGGELRVLALFDKPDPLDGPYFEETIYVTPSRLPDEQQALVAEATAGATRALGLREGPVHAELRVNAEGAWVIEIAARSIGGLCSNTLRFGTGLSLEELILRHALGLDLESPERERQAAGVMMLPIARAGVLTEICGQEAAERIPGIEQLALSIPAGQEVVPLPEGNRYLGFLFARAETPEAVEAALRAAHAKLEFVIQAPGEAALAAARRLV